MAIRNSLEYPHQLTRELSRSVDICAILLDTVNVSKERLYRMGYCKHVYRKVISYGLL